jgi:carboxymethylenebutenolidase
VGEVVTFKSNGSTASGYLATPVGGRGPGVIVIQEWWGLVPHIMDVAERFAVAGFCALAPDLYHGEAANEPDGAGKLMMALNLEQAAKDLDGAVDYLQERAGHKAIGVVGFCMGGGLTLVLACRRPDAVKAAAPFYGVIPWPSLKPDWAKLDAEIDGHYASNDAYAAPAVVRALGEELGALGKKATFHIYPGTEHAFFNDTRPDVYNAEASHTAWQRTVDLFRRVLEPA